MRRLILTALLAPGLACTQSSAWEKSPAPGLVYRMEFDLAKPLMVHTLRWNPAAAELRAAPELGMGTVFGQPGAPAREGIDAMVQRTGAVAGVNADFFTAEGDPIGLMIQDGEIKSRTYPARSIMSWGPEGFAFGPAETKVSIQMPGGASSASIGLNEMCPQNGASLNTPAAGQAIISEPGTLVFLGLSEPLRANGEWRLRVRGILANERSAPVEAGSAVLALRGSAQSLAAGLAEGQEIAVKISTTGLPSGRLQNAIGGGSRLLSKGQIAVDAEAQGYPASFGIDRHPRTAIGLTRDGDLLILAVDGRQAGLSGGASLAELAALMQARGCVEAINLDGGGSTSLSVGGVVVNRPSDGAVRPISNALLLMPSGPERPAPEVGELVVIGRPWVQMGVFSTLRLMDQDGRLIPNNEIYWAALGDAWIDQGGIIRPIKPGRARISAAARGRRIDFTITVTEKGPPAPLGTSPGGGS
jgi:hypothetical protein